MFLCRFRLPLCFCVDYMLLMKSQIKMHIENKRGIKFTLICIEKVFIHLPGNVIPLFCVHEKKTIIFFNREKEKKFYGNEFLRIKRDTFQFVICKNKIKFKRAPVRVYSSPKKSAKGGTKRDLIKKML